MTHKIGIIGCGWIADKMALTLSGMTGYECLAVASRTLDKAQTFAAERGISRAYGSYEELVQDPDVELVYVATPHSHHYEHAMLCIDHGKPVLVEKAFTANARQAEALLALAREKQVFIAEAIWTRYMPLSLRVIDMVRQGVIGHPYTITANLCYPVSDKPRMQLPELAGGTLLDLGVYALNFTAMIYGSDIERTVSACTKTSTGMDDQESITQFFSNRRMAVLTSSMYPRSDRNGVISGDGGFIVVDNINNPALVQVYDLDYQLTAEYRAEPGTTGYEYQVLACFDAMSQGLLESPLMPHAEILRMMSMMDDLRREWGVIYPED